MSDAPQSSSSFSIGRVMLVVIPLALIGWAATMYSRSLQSAAQASLERTMATRLLGDSGATDLSSKLKDADGDLLADPPAEAGQLLDPQEINFSYVASSGEEHEQETWKELVAALESRVGRKVHLVSYADPGEQLRAFEKGHLHITGFATGEVPRAVNEYGFIPVACFADEDGKFSYSMKFIVPADSPIKGLKDIKGKRMTFVRPRSNSGCTAPLVLLMKEHNLQPERDYDWGFSYGHENSIKGIAEGRFSVAAVASDILQRMVASGEVSPDAFRVIYESDPYPPAALGYLYNLTPELRDGIRETLLSLDWAGTGLEGRYGKAGSVKFAPVNYQQDWAPVREINQTGREMFATLK